MGGRPAPAEDNAVPDGACAYCGGSTCFRYCSRRCRDAHQWHGGGRPLEVRMRREVQAMRRRAGLD